MVDEEVGFRLAVKNRREAQRDVHQVGDEFNRVGDQAERAGRKSRTAAAGVLSFSKAGKVAGRAAIYGFGAVSAGVVGAGLALTKLSKDSIGEAREAQKVGAITRAEIKATGRAANVSAKYVGDLAGAISAKVGIDDEAIQSGSNLLLTFKNVRNEVGRGNKIFDRATRSAVDLSAAGFGSIESGSKMLGKALNDPLKGISALSRAGVTFSQEQKDQIAGFVKQNDMLSAQKLILREVEHQVGGVAKSQATWGEKAKVAWGNIEESFGTALLPMLDRTQRWFVQKGALALENYVDIFERKGIPTIRRYAGIIEDRALPVLGKIVDKGEPLAREILPAAGSFLHTAADAFGAIAPKAQAVFKAFNGLPDWAKSAIAITAGGAVVGKKLGVFSKAGGLGGLATKAKPLPVYVVNNGLPGPGTTGGRPGTPSVSRGALKYGGLLAAEGALVAGGAEQMGAYLGNRPWKMPGRDPDYKKHLPAIVKATPHTPVYATIDPMTGLPTFKTNTLANGNRSITEVQNAANRGLRRLAASGGALAAQTDRAGTFTHRLLTELTGVNRPWRPTVKVEGLDAATTMVNALRTNLLGLPALSHNIGSAAPSPSKKTKGGGKKPSVAPRKPFSRVEQPAFDDDFFGSAGAGGGDIHVHNYIDGEKVGSTVVRRLQNKQARR